ncbi:MAG: hypothetical protein Q8Q31_00210 [Nanoarchaeota archaeon]|nr:hypothetical protein [Nanoarchaeota archaeon]
MSFKEFVKELNGSRVEGELIKIVIYSLIGSLIVLAIFYFTRLKYIEGFMGNYAFYLFLAIVSYALIVPSVHQVRSYKQFHCMAGMMIGMTIGMIAGFLSGYLIGATNGMFVGSVFGMIVGISLGAWNGRCCGIMGVMEGMMAGFMAGPMGAMTAVMLLNDNLRAASVILTIVGLAILGGLNFMIYKEMKHSKVKEREDIFISLIISIILTIATTWLMVFGPRSALFQ